jgi:hypothetical protein
MDIGVAVFFGSGGVGGDGGADFEGIAEFFCGGDEGEFGDDIVLDARVLEVDADAIHFGQAELEFGEVFGESADGFEADEGFGEATFVGEIDSFGGLAVDAGENLFNFYVVGFV